VIKLKDRIIALIVVIVICVGIGCGIYTSEGMPDYIFIYSYEGHYWAYRVTDDAPNE
jgi:hypothetical protein